MSKGGDISSQIVACSSSGKDYVKNSKAIFENLAKNSKDYGKNFFTSLNQILGGKQYSPTTKFYALLLLLQATETKKQEVMVQLAQSQDLLNKLVTDAQVDASKLLRDKGKKFFAPTPTKEEGIIGHNYIIMVLEALALWKDFAKNEATNNPLNSFNKIHAALSQTTSFPGSNFYVGYGSKIPNDFHLQSAKVEENIDYLNSEAFGIIMAYASSEGQDKDCIQNIAGNVKRNDENYDLVVLKSVCEILSKPEYSFSLKFHTLYLFVEVVEKGNPFLLDLFTKETPLFRLLYSQAKEASDSLKMSSKSKSKASKDQDSVVKNEYYTLLLEAIRFWNENYGTMDEKSFCINFYRLHASLVKEKIAFPEKYVYLTSKESLKSREAELKKMVEASIISGPDFERNYQNVIRTIEKDSKNVPIYLSITLNLLSATTKLPFSSKFYALYLFLKVTETGNDEMLVSLAQSKTLINELFRDAQFDRKKPVDEKGKTFFKQNPKAEESVLGSNYVELISEAILYWGRVYGTDSKPKVMLRAMSDQLKQVTEVSGEEYYINKDFKAMDQKTLQKFEYIPFRSLPKNTVKVEKPNKAPSQNESQRKLQPVEEKQNKSTGGGEKSKVIFRELAQKIELYEYSKTMLKECIVENEQENEDINEVIDFLLLEVTNSYNNEVVKYIEPVLESDHPEKENYLEIMIKEGETVEELNRLKSNYKQGKISYKEFAKRSLVLLGKNEATVPTPHQEVFKKEDAAKNIEAEVVPEVYFQEFCAHSLLDDEETPKLKPKKDPISIPITATSTKFKKLNLSKDTINKGVVPKFKSGDLEDDKTVPKFKAGDLEDDKNARVDRIGNDTLTFTPKKESRASEMNQSGKSSPVKEYDISKLGQSMRTSKVRMESLLNMETSIKKSYINSGKQPPHFKGLDSNNRLEDEILKLKKQKDELNKQNAILKNKSGNIVYISEEPPADKEKELTSLKVLLADYQNRIDDAQRQLETVSASKINSPVFSASPQVADGDLDKELEHLHKEVDYLKRSINAPLRLTSGLRERESVLDLDQHSSPALQSYYLGVQPLTSREDKEKVLLSKVNYSFHTERESYNTKERRFQNLNYSGLDQFMTPQSYKWEEMVGRTSRKGSLLSYRKSLKPACYRNNLFSALKLRLKDTVESPNSVSNFKMASLRKSGGVLFENNDLQVTISVNNVNSLSFSPQSLQFTLVYCNKTRNLISDLTAEFVELNQASFYKVPEVYKSTIPGEYEIRQQVVFSFAEWSLQVPQICGSYKTIKGRRDIDIFLPILITHFLEDRPTTLDSFSTHFSLAENVVVEGDEVHLDSAILKSPTDFSKYFENLIILNPLQQRGEDTVFGAVLRTKWQVSSYFLKINITPHKKIRFTISTHIENETFVDVILETLQFLFGRD